MTIIVNIARAELAKSYSEISQLSLHVSSDSAYHIESASKNFIDAVYVTKHHAVSTNTRNRGAVEWLAPFQCTVTYLENRLRIRPDGVVSKKLIGERKIEKAIRSCSFLEAYIWSEFFHKQWIDKETYLDRAEDPQNKILEDDQHRCTHSKSQVDTDKFSHVGIRSLCFVYLGPFL